MVAEKTLWATNIEYLNDTSEFKHGENVILETLKRWKRRQKSQFGDRAKFFELIDNAPEFFNAADLFVISLTEKRDQLSQWRGYTQKNSGYSIGFDTDQLQTLGWAIDKMQLVKCLYDEKLQRSFADKLIHGCLERFEQRLSQSNDKMTIRGLQPEIVELQVFSTFVAASMKNAAFSEECEWRLLGLRRDPSKLFFRSGTSSLIPYIQIKWRDADKNSDSNPIRSITVGPCPNPDLSTKAVNRLLASQELGGVTVHKSKIPYKSW